MTQTLGEMLKANQDRTAAEKLAALRASQDKADAKAREDLEEVEEFFNNAREKFTKAILAGKKAKPIELGTRESGYKVAKILEDYNWNNPANRIDQNKKHPYHQVWVEFAEWAKANGLVPELTYCWSGGGEDSWHLLSVKPA